jgi:peptide chain release factor 2
MQMLKQKLFMLKEQENAEKEAEIRGEVMENGFGSQIRSYVLQPYTMVKDLRTGEESGNAQKVLDGDLDQFLRAYLRWLSLGKPKWKGVDAE